MFLQRNANENSGQQAERKAKNLLRSNGYQILTTNFSCKSGEIDIIALNQQVLVFVEVRLRHSEEFGGAIESVTLNKQKRIIRAAKQYLLVNYRSQPEPQCRFDVIAYTSLDAQPDWIKHAFEVY